MNELKMKYCFLAFLLFLSFHLSAQNQPKIDSLLQVTTSNVSDKDKVDSYNQIVHEYQGGDLLKAIQYFEAATQLAKKAAYIEGEVNAYFEIGGIYFVKGDFKKAVYYYKKSLDLSLTNHYISGQASALNGLGNAQRGLGNFSEAIDYFSKAIELFTQLNEKRKMAIASNNVGLIYWDQGDYVTALRAYFKALKIFEELGHSLGIAFCQGNIGHVYAAQKNYQEALQYYFKTLAILEKVNHQGGLLECHNSIAKVYFQQKTYQPALTSYHKALEISKKTDFKEAIGDNLNGLAEVHIALGQYAQALTYLKQSLEMHQKINLKKGVAETYLILGKLFMKKKEDAKALNYFQQGLKIAQTIGAPELVRDAAELLSQAYQDSGNTTAAFENYRLFIQTRDSLKNDKQTKKILQLEFSRERDSLRFVQEKERLSFEEENKRKAATQNASFIGLTLALILILVLGYFFWDRQKRNQKLAIANQKLAEHNEEINTVNDTLTTTLKTVETQRDDILASITYAQRIQTATLPHNDHFQAMFPDYFIFFKPRNVVSGDFYWISKIEEGPSFEKAPAPEKIILAVADCTGHGVPGAFMSMIGNNLLNAIIKEKRILETDKILNQLHNEVRLVLRQKETQTHDGMDMVVVSIDRENNILEFAGANSALAYVQNHQLHQIKGDKMPIGGEQRETERIFTPHTIDITSPTTLYLFSDGYQDQFGGPKGKKFMIKRLRKLLFEIYQKPMEQQKDILDETLHRWMGKEEQVDDILIVGLQL